MGEDLFGKVTGPVKTLNGPEDVQLPDELLDDAMVDESFCTDRWGTWLSGYAPFYGPDGRREGVLGMDIAAAGVIAREQQFLPAAVAVLAVTVPVASLVGWLLGGRVTVESREGEGSIFALWLRAEP